MIPGLGRAAILGVAAALCAGAVGVPLVGAVAAIASHATDASARSIPFAAPEFIALARSLIVGLTIATLSVVFAIPAAWSMRRQAPCWSAFLLAPMLLPSYLLHASWSLVRAPGTPLGDLLEGGDAWLWAVANHLQAVLALSLWSWPIAALALSLWTRRIDRATLESLAMNPGPRWRIGATLARLLLPGAFVAGLMVFLLMLGAAVPLHLAQVDTYAIVIWRRLAEGVAPGAVWLSAAPLLLIAIFAGWILAGRLLRAGASWARSGADSDRRSAGAAVGWIIAAVLVWTISAVLPLLLFARAIPSAREFSRLAVLLGDSALTSLALSACVGAGTFVVALGAALGFAAPRGSLALGASSLCLRLWLIAALTPGVLLGSAVLSAAEPLHIEWLATTWLGAALAHLARFGALGALVGFWLARAEPEALGDLRRLYAGDSLPAWFRSIGLVHGGALLGAALAAMILSLHEIEATVVAAPPGTPTLAERLLNMLHYLRDDQLSTAAFVLGVTALFISSIAALALAHTSSLLRRLASPSSTPLAILLALTFAPAFTGCDRRPVEPSGARALAVIGERGRGAGQFLYPRAIDADSNGDLWIVDKAARVQRISPTGQSLGSWTMPAFAKGKPVGLTIGPDHLLYVADTHENRVAVFALRSDAREAPFLWAWGEYGDGPGQFIYPTDIAVVPAADGTTPDRYFVSEYGGNDRVSAFDSNHSFLFSFGLPGYSEPSDPIVRFNRPQSIIYEPLARQLIVADAANHRLGLFTLEGHLVKWLGRPDGLPGTAPGEFSYPYGLASMSDGTILVSEYGSSRVQRIDPGAGACLAVLGGPGREVGHFVTPWAVACAATDTAAGRIFVLDSGNDRVQVFQSPGLFSRRAQAP